MSLSLENSIDECKGDLNSYVNGLLINPFREKTQGEMDTLIENFMQNTEIERFWLSHFRKGAFLAQDSHAFEREREDGLSLSREETQSVIQEYTNKWNQPIILYALVACCSLSAAVQGWDETAMNQAQVYFLNEPPLNIARDSSEWMLGLVSAAPYLSCAVLGCWLTEPLNRYLGRRGAIFVACLISSLSCVAQAFTSTWWQLFLARFCLGLGIGPKSATVPIYAAECTPKGIRGGLTMMWQTWTAFGICLGYIAGVVLGRPEWSHDLKWRLIIGSPAVIPLLVCAYIFCLPESPRWLLLKARRGDRRGYRRAFNSLYRLRHSRLMAARDLFLIYHQIQHQEQIQRTHNRFVELFTIGRNRRALVASLVCMFFQQFCGVNVFAYYSSLILLDSGFATDVAPVVSAGFGILNFVFALPAIPLMDTFGRRNLLLLTFPFMAIFQLWTGLAFLATNTEVRKVLVTVGMYLFSVSYSVGEGPVPFVYSAESMPLYVREIGMSLVTAINWFFNFLLALTFPQFRIDFTDPGTFCYYAAWCVVGWVLILLLVPETKDQTLEELDARFSIPTKVHARQSIRQLIFDVRYHILRQKGTPDPFQDVETSQAEDFGISAKQPRKKILRQDGEAFERIERLASRVTGPGSVSEATTTGGSMA